MSQHSDMQIFVSIVQAGSLAAAGRQLNLSPASMTARLNKIENRYDLRLLQRSTRSLSLTEIGQRYYEQCLIALEEISQGEAILQNSQGTSGRLCITATVDFGQQHISPALISFCEKYPDVQPELILSDSVVNIIEQHIDLAFRFGPWVNSDFIIKNLQKNNERKVCISPILLHSLEKEFGKITHPEQIQQLPCLSLKPQDKTLCRWFFKQDDTVQSVAITPTMVCNNGSIIRQWVKQGLGLAIKSSVDIQADIDKGELVTLFDNYTIGFDSNFNSTDLNVIYPNRKFMPNSAKKFLEHFIETLAE